MAGRRPKPVKLHKLQGTFNVTRHRGRIEPQASGDLSSKPPPDFFTDTQRELWTDALLDAPAGVLARIDWGLLVAYIETLDRYFRAIEAQRALDRGQQLPFLTKGKNGPITSPFIRIMNHCIALNARLAAEMGFTPSGRARIGALRGIADEAPQAADDAWAQMRQFRLIQGDKA